MWPSSPAELQAVQAELAAAAPPLWHPPAGGYGIGACFVCFTRGAGGRGVAGERGWAAAAQCGVVGDAAGAAPDAGAGRTVTVTGRAGAPYEPGLLALREGPLLEAAVRALPRLPDVLLVDATGRDHPRRAGLALHLGAVLDVPTVGVTHRPLLASGSWPGAGRAEMAPLRLPDGEIVGAWLRTRAGVRPLAVHRAWRTDLEVARAVVLAAAGAARTPEPLRLARRAARVARAQLGG